VRRTSFRTFFGSPAESVDRDSGGNLPDYRYRYIRKRLAQRHRNADGYVIIVDVLFLGTSDLRKSARGVRPGSIPSAARECVRLTLWGVVLTAWLAGGARAGAQDAPPQPEPPEVPADLHGEVVQNPSGPCVKPPTMVQLQDYYGPFHKFIGTFTQKLDRLSVHDPHYKPGLVLCSLEIKDKFADPETFLAAGFDAGISQAKNNDPQFGQGGLGYAKRYGVTYLDEVQFRAFKEFIYPTIFSEDPRYYRIGEGRSAKRFLRPFRHTVIAYTDNGKPMFNFSEWLGEATGTTLSNLYHPGNQRGFGPAAKNVGIDVALDIGYDELKEFWPEIARKLRLPFRDQNEYLQQDATPPAR